MLLLPSEYHFPFSHHSLCSTVVHCGHHPSPGPLGQLPGPPHPHCSVLQAILYAIESELQALNLIISLPFLRSSRGFLSVLFVALQDLCDRDLSCPSLEAQPLAHSRPRSSSHSFSHFGLTHHVLCFWAFVQVVSSAWNVLCLFLFLISA